MKKILKPSPRPFIGFGIVVAPFFALGLWIFAQHGFRVDDLPAVLFPLLLYAGFAIAMMGRAVAVTDKEIVRTSMFFLKKSIRFSDIQRSEVQILAERDHPAWITIFRAGKGRQALSLSLKTYRKEDVAWLCALPEIKAKWFAGFTKKA
ncbi:MAG TPA: hypothetical protein VI956_07470 [Nitrospirota bacterium]|nr:hypothetical protein [Nitrospirota bacterium]